MRKIILFLGGLALLCSGCVATPKEKAIQLVNAQAVDAALLERVRAFAQTELHVPVRAEANLEFAATDRVATLKKMALMDKEEGDVTYIVLGSLAGTEHLQCDPSSGVALVNVAPLRTDDSERFARRVERMVMRAAAFCVGLSPTPDPYCVTRNYRSLEDLDRMGCNYSPPWQARYAEEAARRGLRAPAPRPASEGPQ